MMNIIPNLIAKSCTGQSIFPSLYAGLQDTGTCEVKFDTISDIFVLLGNIISIAMVIASFVAIGFIIFGGFLYIVSNGDASGIKKAKDTIVNAVIGLVIAMLAFGIVTYLTGSFK